MPLPTPVVAGDLDPWTPSASDPWNSAKAAHLLRRIGFGGKPEEVEAVVAYGMTSTVDLLSSNDGKPIQESGSVTLPGGQYLDLSKIEDQRAWWCYNAVHSPFMAKEKLALFWHNHFSVGSKTYNSDWSLPGHINVFRKFGLGRLRDLLIEVTKDSAMQLWLDNYLNGRRGINENYARELLELYTMGVNSGYTQTDIMEAAKCLSGWGVDNENYAQPRFQYRPEHHISGAKTVLGRRIDNPSNGQQDLYDLIDTILAHPKTAEFLARKLWEFFVAPNPPAQIVTDLAAIWRQSGYDVKAIMRVMFRCNYFYSSRAIRQLVKNPMELTLGAVRNLGTPHLGNYRGLGNRIQNQGWPLLRYKNPAGLKGGLEWLGSREVIARMNFGDEITKLVDDDGIRPRFDPFREILRKRLLTDEQIVDHYLQILVDGNASPTQRLLCIQFMNTDDFNSERFQLRYDLVDRKVRGLVHIIMSMPQYQQN
jgi:hypothetical protein